MTNFLTASESSVADADANAYALASASRRKDAAYNALAATYGPAAGDPEAQAQLQTNATNAQLDPLKVQNAQLQTDQAQRADTSSQAKVILNAVQHGIAAGGEPGAVLDSVQHYLPALGVDPAHYAPLRAQLQQDPAATLGKISDQLGLNVDTDKAKLQSGTPVYTKDGKGNVHIHYVDQNGKDVPLDLPTGEQPEIPAAGAGITIQGPPGADGKPQYHVVQPSKFAGTTDLPGAPVAAVQKDRSLAQTDTKLGIDQQNADSNRIRALKPAAARAAASGGALSDDAVNTVVEQMLLNGGKMPALGMGGGPARIQILNAYGAAAKAKGLDGQALIAGQQATAERGKLVAGLASFGPNAAGGKVQSANTLIAHAAAAQQLYGALQSGNVVAINQAKQAYQAATGQPAPTNAALAAKAVGDEAARFTVGTTAVFDRKEYDKALKPGASPEQVAGAFGTIRTLAAGRLEGLRQGYAAAGADHEFDGALTPQAKQALGVQGPSAGSASDAALLRKYGVK